MSFQNVQVTLPQIGLGTRLSKPHEVTFAVRRAVIRLGKNNDC